MRINRISPDNVLLRSPAFIVLSTVHYVVAMEHIEAVYSALRG